MKLLEMTLKGFGRLRNAQFNFHPKINIIFGPNEAGKSTLQQAIVALLYGFYDGNRALPREQEQHEHYLPWDARRLAPATNTTSPAPRVIIPTREKEAALLESLPTSSPVALVGGTQVAVATMATVAPYEPITVMPKKSPAVTVDPDGAHEHANKDGQRQIAGTDYSGTLKYALDGGNTFLIHRDFGNDDVPTLLLDAVTGEDWLGRYRRGSATRSKVDFMEKQTGMSRQVFMATACLQQGALRPLAERDANAVSDAILRLLDAAGADHSAEHAIERLEKKLRELGSDRSQKTLLPQARLRLEELRGAQLMRMATQREVQSDIEKTEFLVLEIEELRAQATLLERQIREFELAQLEARLTRALENDRQREKHAAEIAALLPYQKFPVEEKEIFFQLMHDYNHHDKLRSMLASERAEIEVKLLALAENSKLLRVPEDMWKNSMIEEFLALRSRWDATFQENIDNENAKYAINDALKKAGLNESELGGFAGLDWRLLEQHKTLEAKVKEEEAEVEEARAAYDRNQKDRERRQGFAALGAIAAIVALVTDLVTRMFSSDSNALGIILPICLAALLFVVVLYVRWGARSKELGAWLLDVEDRYMEDRQQLREVLVRYQVQSIQELEQHRLQFEELNKVIQTQKDIEEKMKKIEEPLQVWLNAIGIGYVAPETLPEAEKRLRESHQMWTDANAAQKRLVEIDEKKKQIDLSLSRITLELEEIFQKAGINEPVGEKAFQSFLAGCQKHEYLETLQMQLQQAEALGAEILGGEKQDAVVNVVKRMREELQAFDTETKIPAAPPRRLDAAEKPANETSRPELQRRREKIQEEIHAKEQTVAVLRERVETRLQGLPPLAEIEEDIALVEAEVNHLENARQALEVARDFIGQAAQRLHHDFAPKLNEFLGRHLEKLTSGRYISAMVDPTDFSVRLQGPVTSLPVALTRLSLGTIEQVYMLLRAAVVEIFAENGESIPLLLDDPLVHADARRMANALQMLDTLAESHQIFYFTKDLLVFEHFHGKPEQCAIIAL